MLERDRLLLLEDALDVDLEDERVIDEDDDRAEVGLLPGAVADGSLPAPGPEVTMVCDGRAETTI